ncbi:MAG TPA: hypothetical protein VM869_20640 [Enhygromyxa sp.]|nr:hypothetical protein [Enhygromyxa sp.]
MPDFDAKLFEQVKAKLARPARDAGPPAGEDDQRASDVLAQRRLGALEPPAAFVQQHAGGVDADRAAIADQPDLDQRGLARPLAELATAGAPRFVGAQLDLALRAQRDASLDPLGDAIGVIEARALGVRAHSDAAIGREPSLPLERRGHALELAKVANDEVGDVHEHPQTQRAAEVESIDGLAVAEAADPTGHRRGLFDAERLELLSEQRLQTGSRGDEQT